MQTIAIPRHSKVAKLGALLAAVGNVCAKTVTTTNGTIQGGVCAASGANTFLGIPYALPPSRFAAPESYNKTYDGVLDGSVQPPRCPQFGLAYVEYGGQSEDCLYVDVWVPSEATNDSNLPVKVWLYGGGNEGGAVTDALYDGCNLAADSIVVSVNYRVGPLGFLAYTDAGITGNYGIQDQLLALQWVQDEISSFGGDPDKVLLFGQSAGAWNSYAIASLAQAPSLMRAVAFQSGGGRGTVPVNDTKALYSQYIRSLNCTLDDALDCLRKTSLTAMNKTLIAIDNSGGNVVGAGTLIQASGSGNAWLPVVDGHIIPQDPASVGTLVPAIIGSNTAEGSLDVLSLYLTAVANITQADYNKFLENGFGPLAATVNDTYNWSDFAAASPLQGLAAMTTVITDYAWKCPTYRALQKAATNGVDTWAYNFNHTPSCRWYAKIPDYPQVLQLLGATHTSEIPFVFGWTSDMPRPDGACNFTSSEVALSNFMVRAWTSMAATGRPANDSIWPAWTASGSQGIAIGDSAVAGSLNYSECEFWDKIDAAVLQLDSGAAPNVTNTSSSSGAASSIGNVSSRSDIRASGWIFFGLSFLLMAGMM